MHADVQVEDFLDICYSERGCVACHCSVSRIFEQKKEKKKKRNKL